MTDQVRDYTTMKPNEILKCIEMGEPVPVDEQVRTVMALRAALKKAKALYDEREKVIKRATDYIENNLTATANALGVKGFPTAHGTVSIRTSPKYSIDNMAALTEYILATGRTDMLQRRVSEAAVNEFREANNDALVPGLKVFEKRTVSITKPKT